MLINMKHFGWSTFVIGLMFFSAIAFAVEWDGDTGIENNYFNGSVLIDNVTLPSVLDGSTGSSSVDIEGTGSVTVYSKTEPSMYLNFPGGTTITVNRKYDQSGNNSWWEGILEAPQRGENPSYNGENIYWKTDGLRPSSEPSIVYTVTQGLSNEEYSFSNTATYNITKIPEADGVKLWIAYKETLPPGQEDDAEWVITEGDYCIVENGTCSVPVDKINAMAFAREIFGVCPRSSGSNTTIRNGTMSAEPWCMVSCDRGYEVNYDENNCEPIVGSVPVESPAAPEIVAEPILEEEGSAYNVRPGYFRYTGSSEQFRELDPTGTVGAERIQIERSNAAIRKKVGDDKPEEVAEVENPNKDSFMNYMWRIRDYFGEHSNMVTVSEEVENGEIQEDMEESEVHSSAPLLPSTGPGIFVGLAALGLGLMVMGGRRRH